MGNILKKLNSKWILLFLFMFFSAGTMQAQWDEGNGGGDFSFDYQDPTPDVEPIDNYLEPAGLVDLDYPTIDDVYIDIDIPEPDDSYNNDDNGSSDNDWTSDYDFGDNDDLYDPYNYPDNDNNDDNQYPDDDTSAPDPDNMQNWFLDKDGDGWHSETQRSETSPGPNWSLSTKGLDCNDDDNTKTYFCAVVLTWYLDMDGDGYYSQIQELEHSPGPNWSLWISPANLDCDDTRPEFTTDCSGIKATPCEKAKIANQVYSTINGIQNGTSNLPSNIRIIPPSELPASVRNEIKWTDPVSSFNSTLYRVDNGNGHIEFVYATEGTVSFEDWNNDIQQGQGYESAQYQISVDNAVKLAAWANEQGFNLSFTGHSLGGGLANANALATGLPATIYNPAGLHDDTINNDSRLNLANSENVTAYVVRGEPVDFLNTSLGTPVRGTINYIGSPNDPRILYGTAAANGTNIAGLISMLYAAYHLHAMDNVIFNLDCK